MKYKAIIFDLDGTAILNAQDAMPSERVKEAVKKAEKLIKVSAATGRPDSTAFWVIDALNLENPCVTTAGTQIIDPKTKEILWKESMPAETVKKVLEVVDKFPYDVVLASQYETFPEGPRPQIITDESVIYVGWLPISESSEIINKIKSVAEVNIHAALGYDKDSVGLHVTSLNASKKHAINKLEEFLGVKKEEIIGVGDSNNDLPLFEAVGLKVAMGNATDELKKNADYIAPRVEDDGLAEVIEKFVLNNTI